MKTIIMLKDFYSQSLSSEKNTCFFISYHVQCLKIYSLIFPEQFVIYGVIIYWLGIVTYIIK